MATRQSQLWPCRACGAEQQKAARPCSRCGHIVQAATATPSSTAAAKRSAGVGSHDPYIGMVLNGQYRIERRIGVGGMGAVYLAEDQGMRRKVAIKVLVPLPGDAQDRESRFRREAQAASKLAHPNIVTVHNFGRLKDGTLFLAMEYIEGTDLGRILKHERPLAATRALELGIQIADALVDAHSNGIVHRDLKPDNILVSERRGNELAKILDFGIAKVIDPNAESVHTTRSGLVRGTPVYMSPEQARGDDLDHRTDVYSLGVILYLMLSGDLPIQADSPFGYLHAHQHQVPVPLRKRRPNLGYTASLEALVMRCLSKRGEHRPRDMHEIVGALRIELAHLKGETPDPSWVSIQPLRKRSRVLPSMLGLVLLLTVAGGFAYDRWGASTATESSSAAGEQALVARSQLDIVPPSQVAASAPERPSWVNVPPSHTPEWLRVVGRSGAVSDGAEGRRQAESDAAEQVVFEGMSMLEDEALRRELEAWVGERRSRSAHKVAYARERLLLGQPDPAMEGVTVSYREAQAQTVSGFESATGWAKGGLEILDFYWERYRYNSESERTFTLVWVHGKLPRAELHKPLKRFEARGRLAGMEVVEPYPLIAWHGGDVRGVLVVSVLPESAAGKAGTRVGDLIHRVGGIRVRRRADLADAWNRTRIRDSGHGTEVQVRRANQPELLKLKFPRPRLPAEPSRKRPPHTGGGIDE